ncbi:MAG: hypothetical protein OMM_13916, partial [Candidatus Magnetoglobus multicellularis str. Araruama]
TSQEYNLPIKTGPTFNNIPKCISLNNSVSLPVSFSVSGTKGFLLVSVNSDYIVNFNGNVSLIDIIQILQFLAGANTDSIHFDINNDGRLGFEELGILLLQVQEKKSIKNSYIVKANTDAFFSIELLPDQSKDVLIQMTVTDYLGYTDVESIIVTRNCNNTPVLYIGDHAKINTMIGQLLTVTDEDPNDPISFSITQIMPTTFLKPFRIDPDTGVIILNAPLNAKEVQLYTLTVSVSDGISKAHADVIVQVVDENYCPYITVEPLEIGDHATINTSLGRFTVSDGDPNDPLSYSITQIMPNTISKTFRIDPEIGEIYLNVPLNAKEISLYTLTVSVSDGISSTYANVVIQVIDDNHPPVIAVEPVEIGD